MAVAVVVMEEGVRVLAWGRGTGWPSGQVVVVPREMPQEEEPRQQVRAEGEEGLAGPMIWPKQG